MVDELLLEQRLANLESAVADLQRQLVDSPITGNWLQKVIGSISDEPAFLEALEFGRALRKADANLDDSPAQP